MEVPTKPTPTMNKILHCNTGPGVQLLLHTQLPDDILALDQACGTALRSGFLVSQPTCRDLNTFSPAFTPPDAGSRTSEEMLATMRIEESAAHGKIKDDLIEKLVTHKVTYPRSYHELNHTTKNFVRI